MKVINSGNTFEIFYDSVRTYDQFPSQTYVVRFSKFKGFYLEKYLDMEIKEDKIYGVHTEKVNKVLSSFAKFNRSLGVILSGNKGIGKSLFAKMLSIEAVNKGIPLIVVDTYIPGIASYLESIDQEVMVLFDEFDKTFGEVQAQDGEASPQSTLLSLFDGVSGGKKLFVITCNQINKLNDYLINRPGRFHYHFRFDYPTANEVREYLEDKLDEQYYNQIDDVISFARKINLNYDCLRAIAFEINTGIAFKDAIKDLNIINVEHEEYNVVLHYSNGLIASAKGVRIDMFDDCEEEVYLNSNNGWNFVDVTFNPADAVFDTTRLTNVVYPDKLTLTYPNSKDEEFQALITQAKNSTVECLTISHKPSRSMHYAL